jgi:hypothetical protein
MMKKLLCILLLCAPAQTQAFRNDVPGVELLRVVGWIVVSTVQATKSLIDVFTSHCDVSKDKRCDQLKSWAERDNLRKTAFSLVEKRCVGVLISPMACEDAIENEILRRLQQLSVPLLSPAQRRVYGQCLKTKNRFFSRESVNYHVFCLEKAMGKKGRFNIKQGSRRAQLSPGEQSQQKQWAQSLTAAQITALRAYTYCPDVNYAIRDAHRYGTHIPIQQQQHIDTLIESLEKAPKMNRAVYRIASEQWIQREALKKTKMFTSTSLTNFEHGDEETLEDIAAFNELSGDQNRIVILYLKNIRAGFLQFFSCYPMEAELLLPPGMTCREINRRQKKGVVIVELECKTAPS